MANIVSYFTKDKRTGNKLFDFFKNINRNYSWNIDRKNKIYYIYYKNKLIYYFYKGVILKFTNNIKIDTRSNSFSNYKFTKTHNSKFLYYYMNNEINDNTLDPFTINLAAIRYIFICKKYLQKYYFFLLDLFIRYKIYYTNYLRYIQIDKNEIQNKYTNTIILVPNKYERQYYSKLFLIF